MEKDNTIKVVIADDHRMVREGLKALLELYDKEDKNRICVVGEAGDGLECLKCIKVFHPDVLLLDMDMPKMDGLHLLDEIRKTKQTQITLILTIHNEAEYLRKSMEMGASGYVLKDSESAILKQAIFTVFQGNVYIDETIFSMMNSGTALCTNTLAENLSKREMEVLKLLSEGLYNKEIADKLSISEKTVKNHVSSIFRKIGVSDRTQAAVYAVRNNIVEE